MSSYADWPACETPSFRDYMDEQRELAERRDRNRCAELARIDYSRPKLKITLSVADAADRLGVSTARIKLLCIHGRIAGAYRRRKGKGKPWAIPATWNGKEHVINVSAGTRGPLASYALSLNGRVPF